MGYAATQRNRFEKKIMGTGSCNNLPYDGWCASLVLTFISFFKSTNTILLHIA